MADAVLGIKIVTDSASGAAGLDTTASKAQRLGGALSKMTVPAAVALAAVAKFAQGSVSAAARLEQAMGGVDAVFGKNASTIKSWAADSADSIGLSKASYGELATLIGSQLKNAGLSMDQVTSKTGDLITLGADLAAMYGGTTAQAVEALSSALKGEMDPMDRYGGSLSAAKIAAEQAAQGTDKLTGKAADQAKVMATLGLITKQTADAHGAAAREQDSASAKAQQLNAQYEDLQASLGTALLPLMVRFAGLLQTVVGWMTKHTTATQVIIGVIAALAAGILVLNVSLKAYTLATAIAGSTTAMAWIAAAWPILLVVAAVALVALGMVLLWKKSKTFRTIVLAVWRAIRTAAVAVARAIKTQFTNSLNTIRSAFRALLSAARTVWSGIRSAVSTVTSAVKSLWRGALSAVGSAVRNTVSAIKTAWGNVREAVGNVISKVGDLVGKFRNVSVPGTIKSAIDAIKSAIDKVIGVVQDLIGYLRNIPTPSINWPSPPKWFDKVIGRSALPPDPNAPAGVRAAPVPVSGFAAPRVRGLATLAATGGGGGLTVINVTGALDPEAVARQIQRVQRGHTRRVGLRSA